MALRPDLPPTEHGHHLRGRAAGICEAEARRLEAPLRRR